MSKGEIKTFIEYNNQWCEVLTGEEMAERATELLREKERLNNRIDKAIEYIKNYYFYNSLDFDIKELLDILKESDKNGKI